MSLVNIQYRKACVVYLKLGGIVEYDLCNTNRENLRTTEVNPTNNAAKRDLRQDGGFLRVLRFPPPINPTNNAAKRQQKRGKNQQTR
jgi:hypothetical protein